MTLSTLQKRITRTKISWIFILIIFIFCFVNTNAQTGLNFQGVARNSNNVILASQQISLRLSVLQGTATGVAEYTETRTVTTNAQGLFTAVIGDVGATSTLGNFTTINWKNTPKFLKIEMDPAAGTNFTTMGTTQFQYVAYAQFANGVDAANIAGVVPVEKGGTGVASITALKTALAIDKISVGLANVDNTTDLLKPISTATQTALNLKVDKVVGKDLSTNDYTNAEKIKLAAITGTNTGDQDLSSYATNTSLALKANATDLTTGLALKVNTSDVTTSLTLKANAVDVTTSLANKVDKVTGKVLSTNDYTAAEKTKLAAITGSNTGDQDLTSYATNAALALKANTSDINTSLGLKASVTDVTTSLALKEDVTNKSAAADLGGVSPSDILFPTQKAVKAYVTANSASGGVADGGITNIKLEDGAVTYAKFQSIPTNTILGNTTSSTAVVQAIATTGSDNVVLSTSPLINSPTLVTPNLGIATATSLNNITMTAAGGNPAILSVIGTASVKRENNGDDAPNQRYENLLTDAVSLTTSQPIDGQKTFQNNLVMGNVGGLAGTSSPTTINFFNGSMLGDIQNIHEDDPDIGGSIDLYAPDGAKWVQLNYYNENYIGLDFNKAFIDVGEKSWKFNHDGTTLLPGHLGVQGHIILLGNEIDPIDTVKIISNLNTKIQVTKRDGEGVEDLFNWDFNNTGTTNLPGDLNFTDNHFINFVSAGTSTSTTNASITSTGPVFKIKTREATESELDEDVDYGVELNYANRNYLKVNDGMYFYNQDISSDNYWTGVDFNYHNFNFLIKNNGAQYRWLFDQDGSTVLPGNLEVSGTLMIGDILFPNVPGTPGDVLTNDGSGNAIWSAPTGGSGSSGIITINGVSSGTQSFTTSNSGTDFFIQSVASTGVHTFNLPDASEINRGLLTSADYTTFNNKQDALTNPVTGTGTNGQLSFFNGTNSITSDPKLFWNAGTNSLGIGVIPSTDIDKFSIVSGAPNKNSLLIAAPDGDGAGSQIGFISKNGASTNTGLFQLDGSGNMVFRTVQASLSFDNFGEGDIEFRVGKRVVNSFDYKTPMKIKADQSVNFYSNVNISSGTLSVTGDVTVSGNVTASSFPTSSDLRLKQNILPVQNSLSIIKKLNPVSYEKKKSLTSNDYSIKENGFIAQELQKILPELVHESADMDRLLSVNYTAIIPILTKGIQEQQIEIENLKKELKLLKKLMQRQNKHN